MGQVEQIQTRKVQQILSIDLDDTEILKLADNASELNERIERDEEEFKSIKKDCSSKLKELKKQRDDILTAIGKKHQDRDVECVEELNYETGWVRYLDQDDATKVLSERPMTEDEKQLNFNVEAPTKKKGRKASNVVDFAAPEIGSESEQIAQVFGEETRRKGKRSSLDPVHSED